MQYDKGLLEALREKGYRLTPQRMIVIEAIEESNDHISAEEILHKARVKYPYINVSTVYRILELLNAEGLVAETDLGDNRFLYHPVGKAQHHHLVCGKCSKVRDIEASAFQQLRNELMSDYGFCADFEHIAVFGICKNCVDQSTL